MAEHAVPVAAEAPVAPRSFAWALDLVVLVVTWGVLAGARAATPATVWNYSVLPVLSRLAGWPVAGALVAVVVLALYRAFGKTWPRRVMQVALGALAWLLWELDWWYLAPTSLLLVAVALWHWRLHWWSRRRAMVLGMTLLAGAAAALLFLDWGAPWIDPRLGPGLRGVGDAVVMLPGAAVLGAWGLLWLVGMFRNGDRIQRRQACGIIWPEPGLRVYLKVARRVCRSTVLPGPGFAPPRSARPVPRGILAPLFPGEEGGPAGLGGTLAGSIAIGCWHVMSWLLYMPPVAWWLRWLRAPAPGVAHPSALLRELLAEAQSREYRRRVRTVAPDGSEAAGDPDSPDRWDGRKCAELPAAPSPELRRALANGYYARFVQLTEARIELEYGLFVPYREETGDERPPADRCAAPVGECWQGIWAAYRDLWLDNLDHLAFVHMEPGTALPIADAAAPVDFQRLTATLATAWRNCRWFRERQPSPAAATAREYLSPAAAAWLGLTCLSKTPVDEVSRTRLGEFMRYAVRHADKLSDSDRHAADLACTCYAVACAAANDWLGAAEAALTLPSTAAWPLVRHFHATVQAIQRLVEAGARETWQPRRRTPAPRSLPFGETAASLAMADLDARDDLPRSRLVPRFRYWQAVLFAREWHASLNPTGETADVGQAVH